MTGPPSPSAPAVTVESKPQVRTLLLTDLCESTTLVERLGDALAAALFREHDRLVLELQQRWHGRLIDRSDGLLLLFERPIDGLGFALDYMRGLHELGQSRKLTLQARAGLHVGEVLTWHNSDEAVRAGAKSLEVEGLAKPLAGRLMTLARPGQILLSAVAEPMSHRAASELGERGKHLVWKSYGRWRFKGVPTAQEIHEVGEPGLAALRMPRQTSKAWRDIPLWRRPVALAAEVMLIAGLGTGAWFLTRSPPAIAFSERDWVVVGDLRNLTGQPVLDESLEQAFRISLEQSRYVNVLSDLKVRDTLALMRRKPEEPLDRATASEVALRDGARAVILPTVAEVGGRVRVSAEVIDPHTQTTVYAESADGSGVVSALDSIDKVTGELRNKLGEAIKSIERDSVPLPQVSTSNLDALKAYALGTKKRYSGETKEALGYLMRAVELDPNFALAHLAAAQANGTLRNLPEKRRELALAQKLRSHLSNREALMLDAEVARSGPIEPQLQRWKQVIEMYPDSHSAQMVLAQDGMFYANRYAESLPHAKAASVPQYPAHAMAQYLVGIIQLGMEQYKEAEKSFESSRQAGFKGAGFSYAYVYAAQRDYAKADRILATRKDTGAATAELEVTYNEMLFALDRGQWVRAVSAANQGLPAAAKVEPVIAGGEWRNRKLTAAVLVGEETGSALEADLLREIENIKKNAAETDVIYDSFSEILLLSMGYLGARADSIRVVEKALAETKGSPDIDHYPLLVQMRQVLLAEQERLNGTPQHAVERLAQIAKSENALIPVHQALARAARAAGDKKLALSEAQWLMTRRGRAFVEVGVGDLQTPINVVDSTLVYLDAAELYQLLGDNDKARESLAKFLSIWPQERLTDAMRKRVSALGV
jgi:putative peptide modification system cyclase